MYKLQIDNYEVEITDPQGDVQKKPYNFKESLAVLAMSPKLQLNGYQLLKRQLLLGKILNCAEPTILIEDGEFAELKEAVMSYQGFSRNELEFCRRFAEAEKVEITEKR